MTPVKPEDNKQQVDHKKYFKRFVKLMVNSLVEQFPKRSNVLPAIIG